MKFLDDGPGPETGGVQHNAAPPSMLQRVGQGVQNAIAAPIRAGRQFMYGGVMPKEQIAKDAQQAAGNVQEAAWMLPALKVAQGASLPVRVLKQAALGGLQAGTEGKEIVPAAGMSAAGATVGETIPIVGQRVAQGLTPLVQKAESSRIGKQVGKLLPEMGTSTPQEMFKLAREGVGKRTRTDLLTGMKKVVDSRLGGQEISVPALGEKPMTFQAALDSLEKLGDKAFPKWGTTNLSIADQATMKEARRQYAQARGDIPRELERLSKGAGDLFNASYKRAAAQGSYLELLDESLDKNGRLDTGKMMALLNESPERVRQLMGPYGDELINVLGRGQPLPLRVDELLRGSNPRSWVQGILSPRYKAGPGFQAPMQAPAAVRQGLSAVGGRYPGVTIGAAGVVGEEAKDRLWPGRHGASEGDLLTGDK